MTLVRFLKSKASSGKSAGYLLPTVIILGLAISTVSVVALQSVGQNSSTLSDQYYVMLAREAAQAGIATASKCITSGAADWSNPLVGTSCAGGGTAIVVGSGENFSSGYSIKTPDRTTLGTGTVLLTGVGTVTLTNSTGQKVKTVTASVRAYAKTTATPTGRVSKKVTQVSMGPSTACAVTNDDTNNDHWAYCWGSNSDYQLGNGKNIKDDTQTTPVAVYDALSQVADPGIKKCIAFICSYNPRPTPAQGQSAMYGKHIKSISVGTNHTCAVATDTNGSNGRAYCWGRNDSGQLGNLTNDDSLVPVAVDISASSALNGKDVVAVSAGNEFSCATSSDGKVACWGLNDKGQLGNDSVTTSNYPTAVSTDPYQAPRTQVCVAWNYIPFTNIKIGCRTYDIPADIPEKFASALNGKTVDPNSLAHVKDGSGMCVTIQNDGRATCWGEGTAIGTVPGKLECGADSPKTSNISGGPYVTTRPTIVGGSVRFAKYEIFSDRVIGISTDGHPYWWWFGYDVKSTNSCSVQDGNQHAGSCSGAHTGCHRSTIHYGATYKAGATTIPTGPLYVSTTLNSPLSLSSGNAYNGLFCAVSAGTLYCDVSDKSKAGSGQLGDGGSYPCSWGVSKCAPTSPQIVSTIGSSWLKTNMVLSDIDVGANAYTCAIADNSVGCWGANNSGQLGDGTTTSHNIPTAVNVLSPSALGTSGPGVSSMVADLIYF